MELSTKIINDLQDYNALQYSLVLIREAIETGKVPAIYPMFNDDWNEDVVSGIFDVILEKKRESK
jgi:hypothetical protein